MDSDLRARVEVREAVAAMIKNLGPIVERNPGTLTKAPDFNSLLERARRAFPSSEAIRDTPGIEAEGVTFFELLARLSILDGAVKADSVARTVAATEERSERMRPSGGFLRPRG